MLNPIISIWVNSNKLKQVIVCCECSNSELFENLKPLFCYYLFILEVLKKFVMVSSLKEIFLIIIIILAIILITFSVSFLKQT